MVWCYGLILEIFNIVDVLHDIISISSENQFIYIIHGCFRAVFFRPSSVENGFAPFWIRPVKVMLKKGLFKTLEFTQF